MLHQNLTHMKKYLSTDLKEILILEKTINLNSDIKSIFTFIVS